MLNRRVISLAGSHLVSGPDGVKFVPSFFRMRATWGWYASLPGRITHTSTLVTVGRDMIDHPRALECQWSDRIEIMAVSNVQPISRDTRAPARGGRRAHCCVAAGLLTEPTELSGCLGATRTSPLPSGRLKRPPITFHPPSFPRPATSYSILLHRAHPPNAPRNRWTLENDRTVAENAETANNTEQRNARRFSLRSSEDVRKKDYFGGVILVC